MSFHLACLGTPARRALSMPNLRAFLLVGGMFATGLSWEVLRMTPQNPAPLTGPGAVVQGGMITVQVNTGDAWITVSTGPASSDQTLPVPKSGSVTFPVPQVPPGTVVQVAVGKGLQQHFLLIEVVAPGP